MPRFVTALIGLTLFTSGVAVLAQNAAPALLSVSAQHAGGDVIYRYQLQNRGPGEIVEFFLGCDCRDIPNVRLTTPPTGISTLTANPAGVEVPRESADLPVGWRAYWLRAENDNRFHLYWRMVGAHANGIAPGETVAGFNLRIPGGDPAYLTGYYTVKMWRDGRLVDVSAPIVLRDTTPPALSIEAYVRPRPDAVGVYGQVQIRVKDDTDPSPRVTAESIEPEPAAPDRTYRITYSATDASGNRTSATTLVRLPAPASRPAFTPPKPRIQNHLIVQAALSKENAGENALDGVF